MDKTKITHLAQIDDKIVGLDTKGNLWLASDDTEEWNKLSKTSEVVRVKTVGELLKGNNE